MTIARQLLVLACLQAKPSVGRHRIGQKILNFEGDAAARPELLERARDANSEAPDTGPKYDPGYRARRQTLGLKCFVKMSQRPSWSFLLVKKVLVLLLVAALYRLALGVRVGAGGAGCSGKLLALAS